jgi:hypothetical protein
MVSTDIVKKTAPFKLYIFLLKILFIINPNSINPNIIINIITDLLSNPSRLLLSFNILYSITAVIIATIKNREIISFISVTCNALVENIVTGMVISNKYSITFGVNVVIILSINPDDLLFDDLLFDDLLFTINLY